jgi:hypothetical protein
MSIECAIDSQSWREVHDERASHFYRDGLGKGNYPLPQRPHPQKQNAAVYTKVWTHLKDADPDISIVTEAKTITLTDLVVRVLAYFSTYPEELFRARSGTTSFRLAGAEIFCAITSPSTPDSRM